MNTHTGLDLGVSQRLMPGKTFTYSNILLNCNSSSGTISFLEFALRPSGRGSSERWLTLHSRVGDDLRPRERFAHRVRGGGCHRRGSSSLRRTV